MIWFVYILYSESSNCYYVGVSTDPQRRLNEHNTSPKGAKRTKAGRPWTLAYTEGPFTRSDVMKREWGLKKLNHVSKARLVSTRDLRGTTPTISP